VTWVKKGRSPEKQTAFVVGCILLLAGVTHRSGSAGAGSGKLQIWGSLAWKNKLECKAREFSKIFKKNMPQKIIWIIPTCDGHENLINPGEPCKEIRQRNVDTGELSTTIVLSALTYLNCLELALMTSYHFKKKELKNVAAGKECTLVVPRRRVDSATDRPLGAKTHACRASLVCGRSKHR
jgi:hypothetical protein